MAFDSQAILKAIRDHWLADSALVALIPDLYLVGAVPQSVGPPSATLLLVGNASDHHLTDSGPKAQEMVLLDITLYSNSRSAAEITAAHKAMCAAFDNATITFGGAEYVTVLVSRESVFPLERDGNTWRLVTSYRGTFDEQ